MYFTLEKTEILILATLNLSSVNALNLEQSKILSFGKELRLHVPLGFGKYLISKLVLSILFQECRMPKQ